MIKLTLFEQWQNIQDYGDRGGYINLSRVSNEIWEHHRDKEKKKKEKKETMTFIEKMVIDMITATGSAVVRKAIDDLIDGFNSGKW